MKTQFLALLLVLNCTASAQCIGDTIPLIAGWIETDTLYQESRVPCFPYQCSADACHLWQLPDSFNGIVNITGDGQAPVMVSVQFWRGCDTILLDTCIMLDDPSMGPLFYNQWPQSTQIQICGPAGTEISIVLKGLIAPQRPMTTPKWLKDTLCLLEYRGPVDHDWNESQDTERAYIDLMTGQRVVNPVVNRLYYDQRSRRKVIFK